MTHAFLIIIKEDFVMVNGHLPHKHFCFQKPTFDPNDLLIIFPTKNLTKKWMLCLNAIFFSKSFCGFVSYNKLLIIEFIENKNWHEPTTNRKRNNSVIAVALKSKSLESFVQKLETKFLPNKFLDFGFNSRKGKKTVLFPHINSNKYELNS